MVAASTEKVHKIISKKKKSAFDQIFLLSTFVYCKFFSDEHAYLMKPRKRSHAKEKLGDITILS